MRPMQAGELYWVNWGTRQLLSTLIRIHLAWVNMHVGLSSDTSYTEFYSYTELKSHTTYKNTPRATHLTLELTTYSYARRNNSSVVLLAPKS